MVQEQAKINQQYVIDSLQMQISKLSLTVAHRDAVLTTQYQRIQELEKENDQLRDEKIAALDKQAEKKLDQKPAKK